MKNDWELYIKDENKSKWRKVKHTNLTVNRKWGLEASKVSCAIKNIAGYNFDWVRESKKARLYKNGKFFLYLHITTITPSRTTKDSILKITFEDYWFYRLKKQLTCSEVWGDLKGIGNHNLIKQAMGTLVVMQDRFDSETNGISIRSDRTTYTKITTMTANAKSGQNNIFVNDVTAFILEEELTIAYENSELIETHRIYAINSGTKRISFHTDLLHPQKSGEKVGLCVTSGTNVVMREETERPDGFLELKNNKDGYARVGWVQSQTYRNDDPSWSQTQDINSVMRIADEDKSHSTDLYFYFSRDDGETWYNITFWTDDFHDLTGSEVVKNKPKWKARLIAAEITPTALIDEDFSSTTNWTKTGTQVYIDAPNGKVCADLNNSNLSEHSIRYNTDLTTLIDLWTEDWELEFHFFAEDSTPAASGNREPFYLKISSKQESKKHTASTNPNADIGIWFWETAALEGDYGLFVDVETNARFNDSEGNEHRNYVASPFKKFANLVGQSFHGTLKKENTSLKLFLYTDALRTHQWDGSPLELSLKDLWSGLGDKPPSLRWMYWSNRHSGFSSYGDVANYELAALKLWKGANVGTHVYSPKVDTVTILCKMDSESGLQEGTIEDYTAPVGVSNKMDIRFSREHRLSMLQQILSLSPTATTSNNPSPVWDCWIETTEDGEGKLNFKEYHNVDANYEIVRKGESVGDNYIKSIDKEVDLTKLFNAIYLVGGGWAAGIAKVPLNVFVATDDVKNALTDVYNGKIISRRVFSEPTLKAMAFTLLEMLKKPQNTYTVVPYPEWRDKFKIGEFVTVKDLETDTLEKLRIREEKWSISGSAESLNLTLETGVSRAEKYLTEFVRNQRANETSSQGAVDAPPISYNDNYDAEHPPELWFYVPANKHISKISLFLKNQRFRAYSKSAKGESAHTHGQIAHVHTIGGKSIDATIINISEETDAKPEDGTSQLLAGVTGNSGNLLADSTWRTIRPFQYTGVDTDVEEILHHLDLRFDFTNVVGNISVWSIRIRHASTGTIYYPDTSGLGLVKAQASNIEQRQSVFRQLGKQKQYEWWYLETLVGGNGTYRVDYYWDVKKVDTRHTHNIGGKIIDGTVVTSGETSADGGDDITETGSSHEHEIDFGVYEYPYYVGDIEMFIDGNVRPSSIFGRRGTESKGFETMGLDITPDFDSVGDGFVDSGWHVIRFIPAIANATNNTGGLGRMMVYLGFDEVMM